MQDSFWGQPGHVHIYAICDPEAQYHSNVQMTVLFDRFYCCEGERYTTHYAVHRHVKLSVIVSGSLQPSSTPQARG